MSAESEIDFIKDAVAMSFIVMLDDSSKEKTVEKGAKDEEAAA